MPAARVGCGSSGRGPSTCAEAPERSGSSHQLSLWSAAYKVDIKTLKVAQRMKIKACKAGLKRLEALIPTAERGLKLLSTPAKLELILADDDQIGTLNERWISAEVAKRLDYPIFMAVSERGGKNHSVWHNHSLLLPKHMVLIFGGTNSGGFEYGILGRGVT